MAYVSKSDNEIPCYNRYWQYFIFRFQVRTKSGVRISDSAASHDSLTGNQSGGNDQNRGCGHHWSSVTESKTFRSNLERAALIAEHI